MFRVAYAGYSHRAGLAHHAHDSFPQSDRGHPSDRMRGDARGGCRSVAHTAGVYKGLPGVRTAARPESAGRPPWVRGGVTRCAGTHPCGQAGSRRSARHARRGRARARSHHRDPHAPRGGRAGHRRALSRSAALTRVRKEVGAAYGRERQAADLLGDAPGTPVVTELPIPVAPFGAFALALAHDGRSLWVSGSDASRILLYPSLEPGSQPLVFKLRPGSYPHGIAVGPDDALYVAETGTNIGGNAIARLTASGDRQEFVLPAGLAGAPWGIAVGPDRDLVHRGRGREGRPSRPGDGQARRVRVADGLRPATRDRLRPGWCALGDGDGRKSDLPDQCRRARDRVSDPHTPQRAGGDRGGPRRVRVGFGVLVRELLRISASGRQREFRLPAGGRPYGLASAPDGNVWFTDRGRNAVGVVTPAGHIVEYPLTTPNAQPTAIVPLALGQFAYSEFVANAIGVARFTALG